jgi:hypothetical protein
VGTAKLLGITFSTSLLVRTDELISNSPPGREGGLDVNCADNTQPGVPAITNYLQSLETASNCAPSHFYWPSPQSPAACGGMVSEKLLRYGRPLLSL